MTATPDDSDDYYVRLQPLTLDFVAKQLERIDVRFTAKRDVIEAQWESFVVTVGIVGDDVLNVRVLLLGTYPSEALTSLVGRCNWWNSSRVFLKASAIIGTAQAAQEGDSTSAETRIVSLVKLESDVPCPVGIAPVQFQALFEHILRNTNSFRDQAGLGSMLARDEWD